MRHPKSNASERSRAHPDERFAELAERFNLSAAAAALSRETSTTTQGHRQRTLYRHGNASLALFLFDAGSGLREHRADGTVFIQVLQGRLRVGAEGVQHELIGGNVLVMAPGVAHDLRAEEPTQMLLTVCLKPKKIS